MLTTEVSPWNDQYYKITGVLNRFTGPQPHPHFLQRFTTLS